MSKGIVTLEFRVFLEVNASLPEEPDTDEDNQIVWTTDTRTDVYWLVDETVSILERDAANPDSELDMRIRSEQNALVPFDEWTSYKGVTKSLAAIKDIMLLNAADDRVPLLPNTMDQFQQVQVQKKIRHSQFNGAEIAKSLITVFGVQFLTLSIKAAGNAPQQIVDCLKDLKWRRFVDQPGAVVGGYPKFLQMLVKPSQLQ